MKVIALQNYSDNYTILREGLIYDLSNNTANKLITKGVCAISTGSPDDVSITQSINQGTEIANITINGENTSLYAPAGSSSSSFEVFNFSQLITIQDDIMSITETDIVNFLNNPPYMISINLANSTIYAILTKTVQDNNAIVYASYGTTDSNFDPLCVIDLEQEIAIINDSTILSYDSNNNIYTNATPEQENPK